MMRRAHESLVARVKARLAELGRTGDLERLAGEALAHFSKGIGLENAIRTAIIDDEQTRRRAASIHGLRNVKGTP